MSLDQDERTAKEEITPEFLRETTGINAAEEKAMEDRASEGATPSSSESKKILSGDEIAAAESNANKDTSEPLTSKAEKESANIPPSNWKANLKARQNSYLKSKGLLIGVSLGLTLIGGLMMLISFLLPFKVTAIIEQIEQRVGQVPEYAIERRLEYYMNRYLIIRSLESSGVLDFNNESDRFTYLGNGVFSTLYTNWRGANLESKLIQEYNVRLVPKIPQGEILGRQHTRPTNWQLEDLGVDSSSDRRYRDLDSREARKFINEFTRSETKSRQIIRRHHMRSILKKYYGVNRWKPFEKTRNNTREKYIEKKTAFKQYAVRQTVGRVSERYGLYLDCLLEGGEKCDDIRKGATDNDRVTRTNEDGETVDAEGVEAADNADRNSVSSSVDEAVEAIDGDGVGDNLAARIKNIGLRKVLASFAAGIGLVDAIAQIQGAVDSGALSIVVYDSLAHQYAGFGTTILSAADQQRAGEDMDPEDARVLAETFDNFEESPVYQAAYWEPGSVSALAQISRDCDDNPNTPPEILEPGELVCPNKKLLQDRAGFTSAPWWSAIDRIGDLYRGTIGGIVGAINDAVSAITSALGIDEVIQQLLEVTGLDDVIASAVETALDWFLGFSITGAEEGGDAYEALYAGIAVKNSSLGGSVGGDRSDTIGGQYLSDAEVASIQAEMYNNYKYELKNRSFFARYFSPSVKESIVGNFAMHMPVTAVNMTQNMASFFNPSTFLSSFSSIAGIFTSHSQALPPATLSNPYGVINSGYPTDHEIFTANNGTGMTEEEVNEKYMCDESYDRRLEANPEGVFDVGRPDDMPFDVNINADPCLLEEAVEEAGSMHFTGEYDEGIDTSTSTPTSIESGTDTSDLSCPDDPEISDGGIAQKYGPGKVLLYEIRLCIIRGNVSFDVNVSIAQNVINLLRAAEDDGVNLTAGAYRSYDEQKALRIAHGCPNDNTPSRACSPPTARPGTSNHENGEALDFRNCSSGSTCFNWLSANAANYGLYNLPSESWHWSVNGR